MSTVLYPSAALGMTLLLGMTFFCAPILAQLPEVAPKPLPANPAAAAPELPAAEKERREKKPETVFVKKLKGIVFCSKADAVHYEGIAPKERLTPGDVPLTAQADFRPVVQPFFGQPISLASLDRLTSAIVRYYRAHDRPIVNVFVPQQNITNGYVQVVIVEGRVEKVAAVGAHWFDNQDLKSDLRLHPGDPISNRKILGDVDWINRDPFRLSNVVYGAGLQPGTTDVTLKTVDRFPARFYLGYEDSGNQATGFDRYEAGLNWGDAFHFGQGQQLNYQYTTSGNFYSLRAHSASYVVPLPWRHVLTVFGDYEDSKGVFPPVANITGRNYQISFRYDMPLPTYRGDQVTVHEDFSIGYDNKYNNNSLIFDALSAGQTLYEVDQFVFNYTANETDLLGSTTVNETLNESPGGFGGYDTDAYYGATHPGATSSYLYNTLILERDTHLPADMTLVLRGTVQHSSGNLVPSEQMGFGGYNTVRGYDDREVNADEGYVFNAEVRSPQFSLSDWTQAKGVWKDQMQVLGFWDYGVAGNHTLLEGEPDHINLSSVGAGIRYNVGTYLTVRFDYGFQLLHTGLDLEHGSRGNIGVTLSY